MFSMFANLGGLTLAILCMAVLAAMTWFAWWSEAVVFIPNNRIGIVEKRFGSRTLPSGFMALNKEVGFQPDLLRGGFHFFMPFQFKVHRTEFVVVQPAQIAYVYARDGKPLEPHQVLGRDTGSGYENARSFLESGGQKGPQRAILREGMHAINKALFVIFTSTGHECLELTPHEEVEYAEIMKRLQELSGFSTVVIDGASDEIGIVTVMDGPALPEGDIIAPATSMDHSKFQNAEKFLAGGGYRGRQLDVLTEGTYYINRMFASVEKIKKTIIEVGEVGVVTWFTGEKGEDISGVDYQHGELVKKGQRGVWDEVLLPGKYPFNTYAGRISKVPTTNFILKWESGTSGSRFDQNLKEITLITNDAFEPDLPLSVVLNIDYRNAPLVIQRFGDIQRLVEQTLDPMVSAYFKNESQTRSLIELLQQRSNIQEVAGIKMRERFLAYNLNLQEVLIGTPRPRANDTQIETILQQLRSRQVAKEQETTFACQQAAALVQKDLEEAQARAKQQAALTQSNIDITIAENQGKAEAARAEQAAKQMQHLAEGTAAKTRLEAEGQASAIRCLADAESTKVERVGQATAKAAELQVQAMGGPEYRLQQEIVTILAQAIREAAIPIVPQVQVGGAQESGVAGLLSAMLAGKVKDQWPAQKEIS